MVPGSGGREGEDDDSAVAAVASNIAPQSAFPPRVASPELQVTALTTSDSTPTVAAPAQEHKDEQQQQQQPPPPQLSEQQQQHHEPQPQPPPPQQNGDSRASETNTTTTATPESDSDMASHRSSAATLHGLHAGYPTSSSSALYSPQIPTTQYASYPTVTSAAQPGDAYRVSPVGTPQMSLPSMRTIDAMSQQSVPPISHHSMSMGMSMPLTAVSATPPYFAGHSTPLPSNYGFPQEALARYPLPHDPRLINHRGPKKCDETHPTCNNCRKSKRECLGYDPIFRQQVGTPAGSSVQPASNNLSQSTESSAIASLQQGSAVGQQPPTPRLVNSYGSQSPMLPSVYATGSNPTTPSIAPNTYNPPLSTAASAQALSVKPDLGYSYSSNIDPAVRSMTSMSANQLPLSDHSFLRAKKMKIDEIIDLLGPPAPIQQISHTEETFNEITKVYHEMYASGLSAFFETSWYYFTENGKMSFPKDANLIEHMATFLKILEGVKANDHTQMAYSGVLETRIVWELACTAYQVPERVNNSMRLSLPLDNDAVEARNRLQVVEALLCGDELLSNPLSPPVADGDHHRVRQFDFWYSLAEFVRRRDNPNAPATVKIREDVLSRMRHLLDGRENRDVLYSIAVVRELAPNFDSGYATTIPQHLDETDPKNRLAVASKFILDESQVTGGTTNVVRRFSDIASRAFVNPGVNIARRV
ncbi:c6 finger domain-containing [Trichoderma arundinaceum]|uniref:C6 finger domain-containing n=1 Tax=Trichoderma arundinaceum TaxID=490622 RepID=A0A395NH10_TRIAR|nr:c6 finger domain-containing [Trichoderma arundinaceum]